MSLREAEGAGPEGSRGEPHGTGSLGVPTLSETLVDRHGGRTLHPARAVLGPRAKPPSPTSYRSNTLLVPDSLLRQKPVVRLMQCRLHRVGLTFEVPPPIEESLPELDPAWLPELRDLPRAVVLRVRDDAPPTSVDAWVALQALRAESPDEPAKGDRPAKGDGPASVDGGPVQDRDAVGTWAGRVARAEAEVRAELDEIAGFVSGEDHAAAAGPAAADPSAALSRIGLDHLMYAGVIMGEPATEPNTIGGTALADVSTAAVFTANSRIPVTILAEPPRRSSLQELARAGVARRPVIAVLDTGVREHPWLGDYDAGNPGDPFWTVEPAIQSGIAAVETTARNTSGLDVPVLQGPVDVHDVPGPRVGLLDSHIGHGTFISGVILQTAPDARIRMIRVMHTDGVVTEQALVTALHLLAAQVAVAQTIGDPAGLVDVVSLSMGYYDEDPESAATTGHLAGAVGLLTGLGVAVVASAGNDATVEPCFPAALVPAGGAPELPVVGVGALNPDGTEAMFSNYGRRVTMWAHGADVISTYPVDLDGGEQPVVARDPYRGPFRRRATLDPDRFRGGFAVWSGTSFAAPRFAAALADALLEQAKENHLRHTDADHDLAATKPESVVRRTADALKRISTREHA